MTIAYITTRGDPSVGINGCCTTVDLNLEIDDENREGTRMMLSEFFADLWDSKACVLFDDEFEEPK